MAPRPPTKPPNQTLQSILPKLAHIAPLPVAGTIFPENRDLSDDFKKNRERLRTRGIHPIAVGDGIWSDVTRFGT
jgi:hypothetical protein